MSVRHGGHRTVVALAVLAVGLFHLAVHRDGFNWFTDVPAYVQHAENLVEGRDYAASGFLPNPYRFIAPRAHPPGLPLLLAPVVLVFGADPVAMRVLMVVLLLASLAVLAVLVRDRLSPWCTAGLVAAVGLHPAVWRSIQTVSSDIPFVLFVLLALLAYRRADGGAARLGPAALAGAAVWYAVMTRAIGLALLPALIAVDLLRHRRPTRVSAVAVLTCLVLLGAHKLVARTLAGDGGGGPPIPAEVVALAGPPPGAGGNAGAALADRTGYGFLVWYNLVRDAEQVPLRLPRNLVRYGGWLDDLWENGFHRGAQHVLFLVFAVPAAAGFVLRLRRGVTVIEVFAVVYLLALLPWSFSEPRYLFPLVPLYFLYLLEGAAGLQSAAGNRGPAAALLVVAALAVTYAGAYARANRAPYEPVFDGPDAARAYETVAEDGGPIVAEFPRQIARFSGRIVTAPPRADQPDDLWWRYVDALQARWIVVGPKSTLREHDGVEVLEAFVARHPDRLEQVLDTARFEVYRVRS